MQGAHGGSERAGWAVLCAGLVELPGGPVEPPGGPVEPPGALVEAPEELAEPAAAAAPGGVVGAPGAPTEPPGGAVGVPGEAAAAQAPGARAAQATCAGPAAAPTWGRYLQPLCFRRLLLAPSAPAERQQGQGRCGYRQIEAWACRQQKCRPIAAGPAAWAPAPAAAPAVCGARQTAPPQRWFSRQ